MVDRLVVENPITQAQYLTQMGIDDVLPLIFDYFFRTVGERRRE